MVRLQLIKWKLLALSAALLAHAAFPIAPAYSATTRIKDIADFESVRENMLVGYGLVVGLNGTGDSIKNSPFTEQSLYGMLERLGVNVRGNDLKTKNVAAVMVTATLPAFTAQGSRIDINVSALGDAKNLMGGMLLVTPLMGADGDVYAVGQGPVATSAISAEGKNASVTRGVPTSGRVSSGAIVEKELAFDLNSISSLKLNLRNPDFTTSRRVAEAINKQLKGGARQMNSTNVEVQVPANRQGDIAGLITDIEQLNITPDQVAKVVIDEKSGVIVMGENVRISTVAISQGNLTIRITETPQVSQPGAFAQTGQTAVVDRTNVEVDDQSDRKVAVMKSGISLQELVKGLNALGVGPRDIITILQSIKAAGALQAEVEVL